ncbi:MAG: methyl-accepting chemotaxis protein [Thermaerobacter sp.]|nr:methyl-accepting chemotaxis protein [Thermaerobacter sp.]
MRMGITAKIAGGYVIGLVLLVIVSVVALTALDRTTAGFRNALSDLSNHAVLVLQARGTVNLAAVDYLRYRLTGDKAYLNTLTSDYGLARLQLSGLYTASSGSSRAAWGQALTLLKEWDSQAMAAAAASNAGHSATSLKIFQTQVVPLHDQVVKIIGQQVAIGQAQSARDEHSASAIATGALWAVSIASALAVVVAAVMAVVWMASRSLSAKLREAIATLTSSAAELLAATTQQAAGTSEEAAAVQETSTTIEELKQTVEVSAKKAEAVATTSQKTDQVSDKGRRAVADTVQRMREVRQQMENLAERILSLAEQSQAIGGITTVVSDLAEQSNLLAVNAAIEAARAGDAGRGFAVVATEVKSLAEQSKQATGEVRGILADIQRATQAAVMAMEQGVKMVTAGEAVAVQSGEAIAQLTSSISASTQMAHQILASSQQQVAGVDQISAAMRNIQQSSVQNMASTRQVERAAQNLNELAGRLNDLLVGTRRGPGKGASEQLLGSQEFRRPQ